MATAVQNKVKNYYFLGGIQAGERVCACTCVWDSTYSHTHSVVRFLKSPLQTCCTCCSAAWNVAWASSGPHLVLIWARGLSGLPPRQARPEPLITWQSLELTAAVSELRQQHMSQSDSQARQRTSTLIETICWRAIKCTRGDV